MNNGIACVAASVDVDHDRHALSAKSLQVINGAQTVKSLVKASKKEWANGEPLVLVRVTEIPIKYSKAGRFREDVIRANNTQNVIKISDFRSNDSIQTDLQKRFNYRRFGRQVRYVPKRTAAETNRNTDVIRLEEFSKVIYSFLRDPTPFSSSTSYLFDDSENKGYCVVFGDGEEAWGSMPEEEFRLRSTIWWIAASFGATLKGDRRKETDEVRRMALERKWWILFAARVVLEANFGSDYPSVITPFYKGDWTLGNGKTGTFFQLLYNRAVAATVMAYRAAKNAPGSKYTHRNWMRSSSTVREIEDAARALSEGWEPLRRIK